MANPEAERFKDIDLGKKKFRFEKKKRGGGGKDLSREPGNPTSYIQDNYQRLMAIDDFDELMKKMQTIFAMHRGKGFSDRNSRRALQTLEDIKLTKGEDIDELKRFITNFMLRGSGLGVIGDDLDRITAALAEDHLTDEQAALIALTKNHFQVGLIAEEDVEIDEADVEIGADDVKFGPEPEPTAVPSDETGEEGEGLEGVEDIENAEGEGEADENVKAIIYTWEEPQPGRNVVVAKLTPEEWEEVRQAADWVEQHADAGYGESIAAAQIANLEKGKPETEDIRAVLDDLALQSRYNDGSDIYTEDNPIFAKYGIERV